MAIEYAKAEPTKEYFVSMFVRDIYLKEAIIELIDNSIDGAKKSRKDNNYNGIYINVKFDENEFSIEDNCGGIDLETAKERVFAFGRETKEQVDNENESSETTGVFGVGMKRALFKMGNNFEVESKTKSSTFKVKLDVTKWIAEPEWLIPFENFNAHINPDNEIGTTIHVTNLYPEISQDFIALDFKDELKEHIQRRVGLDIDEYGLEITINGDKLVGNNISLIDEGDIKPIKEEYTSDNNIKVTILAGIAPKPEGEKAYDPKEAGWYIYCNRRLVVAADKTSLTTWKDIENKSSGVLFHNRYASFRGIVFFSSNEPQYLPWNTTKTGIDESSRVYIGAKFKMIEVFKIVRGFIDDLRTNSINVEQGSIEDIDENDEIEKTVSAMKSTIISFKNLEAVLPNRELDISKVKPDLNPMINISYKKPQREVDLIKEHLGVSSNKKVGEMTFDYYIDAECD